MPRRDRGDASYLADMLTFAQEVLTFTKGRSRSDYETDAVAGRCPMRAKFRPRVPLLLVALYLEIVPPLER